MNWINHYIDQPLLNGATTWLRTWHIRTGQRPDRLETLWHMAVALTLLAATVFFFSGLPLAISWAAIVMLMVPSATKLYRSQRDGATYGSADFKALRARAIAKRETEWALRLTILAVSAGLPYIARIDDPVGARFLLGATLWFVLTAPVKFYLDAAEPPTPHDGDRLCDGKFQFN